MNKLITAAVLSCTLIIRSQACPPPANMEGVAFTNGETLDLSVIADIGTENVNYFADGEEVLTGIRYMSHYDPKAMVFIGNYGMSYQEGTKMNCMGIILPLPDTSEPYAEIKDTTFDFTVAVITELEWLVKNSIVTLSDELIAHIDSTLSAVSNGGEQYWTHTKKVLSYNTWYTYDTTENRWRTENDVAVDGVRAVNAIQGVWGCASINPELGLPPASLDATPVSRRSASGIRTFAPYSVTTRIRLAHFTDGNLVVPLPQNSRNRNTITLFNSRGAVVYRSTVQSTVGAVTVRSLPRGMYYGAWR